MAYASRKCQVYHSPVKQNKAQLLTETVDSSAGPGNIQNKPGNSFTARNKQTVKKTQ